MLVLDTDFVAFSSPGSERACTSSSSCSFRSTVFLAGCNDVTWTPHSADRGREIKFKVILSCTGN